MSKLYIVRDENNARKVLYIDDHRKKVFINGRLVLDGENLDEQALQSAGRAIRIL